MPLILMLSLLAQPPARDAFMTFAVEDFVYRTRTVRHFDGAVPEPALSMLRAMACDRYACRRTAVSALMSSPDGFRAACWGVHSADAEIRSGSLEVLKASLPCPHCSGDRYCPAKHVGDDWRPYANCPVCDASGYLPVNADLPYELTTRIVAACRNCRGSGNMLRLLGM